MKKKIIIALTIVLCFSIMILKKASATTTSNENVVPNNGYVENIYFNKSLTFEDIVPLFLNNAQSSFDWGEYCYLIFFDGNTMISFMKDIGYYILGLQTMDGETNMILWSSGYDGVYGWNENFNGCVTLNGNALSEFETYSIGNDNDKLTDLISLIPIENNNSNITQEELENAYNDGLADGWDVGYDEGYEQGWNEGEREGYNDGCVDGYEDGYEEGIKKGEEVNASFADMFLNILDAPRQAISNILNFEFLGINLASLVFFLITAILVVVIIKFFI